MIQSIGRQIKALREEHGISIQEFAQACGVKRSTIGDFQSGKALPSLPVFIAMAQTLKVGTSALLCGCVEADRFYRIGEITQKMDKLSAEQRAFILPILTSLLDGLRREIKEPNRVMKPIPTKEKTNLAINEYPARLREGRLARGFSIEKLALEVGLSSQSLSKHESGTYRPLLKHFIDLCNVLNVNSEYLLGGNGIVDYSVNSFTKKLTQLNAEQIDYLYRVFLELINRNQSM